VVVFEQRQLETVFCGIECDGPWTSRTVETIYSFALHTGQINRVIEGTDYTVISVTGRQASKSSLTNMWLTLVRDSI
jgi:hypothetical protein